MDFTNKHDCTKHLLFDHGESGGWSVVIKCDTCGQKWYPQWMVAERYPNVNCDVVGCAGIAKNADCPMGRGCKCKCHARDDMEEPEISTGCSEMHGPGWKDFSELEEKFDKSRTRDRAFRNDLFDFLEGLARGFPVKSDLCLNDLRKKYL